MAWGGPEELAEGVKRLARGRLVAFPTETVYGLGADATDGDAVARVFEAKGRPAENPLIVHVSGEGMARTCARSWPEAAARLARRFWPGPVTLVVEKSGLIPGIVTAGGETVALRAPDHPLALALIETLGRPIVGPSANRSGGVSPTRAEHVRASLGEDVYVLDGGACRVGIESTVVRVMPDRLLLLRPGAVGAEALGECAELPVEAAAGRGGEALGSPGRVGPHYRPSAPMEMVEDLGGLGARLAAAGDDRVVVIGAPGAAVTVDPPHGSIPMPSGAGAYAAELYAALREADAMGAERILVVRPPTGADGDADAAVWGAVTERLSRACGG